MTPGQAVYWVLVGLLGCFCLFCIGLMAAGLKDVWRHAGR